MKTPAETLRGTLDEKKVDARRIMQAAKNPACVLARTALLAGIDMEQMAKTAFGATLGDKQSPFAMRQGTSFERRLSENGAARLVDALVKKGLLAHTEVRVRDLGAIKGLQSANPAVRAAAIRQAITETDRELRRKAAGDPMAYNVLLQAQLPIKLADDGIIALLRADALIAPTSARAYTIGEIKSFPALHHNTDGHDIAAAAAQAGVYAVALEGRMRALGLSEPVPTNGILILRTVGSFNAAPTLQPIDRDIDFARRMLARRPRTLAEVSVLLGPRQGLDKAENILKLPRNFIGGCRSFCPMAKVCQNLAIADNQACSVSKDLGEMIGSVKTNRALALLHGATPATPDEAEVQKRLQTVYAALRQVG